MYIAGDYERLKRVYAVTDVSTYAKFALQSDSYIICQKKSVVNKNKFKKTIIIASCKYFRRNF